MESPENLKDFDWRVPFEIAVSYERDKKYDLAEKNYLKALKIAEVTRGLLSGEVAVVIEKLIALYEVTNDKPNILAMKTKLAELVSFFSDDSHPSSNLAN